MAPIAWLLLSLVILEARRVYGNLGGECVNEDLRMNARESEREEERGEMERNQREKSAIDHTFFYCVCGACVWENNDG